MTPEEERDRLDAAAGEFSGSELEVSVQRHGCEHYHPEVGEYWRPKNLTVKGDMTDQQELQLISDVCDRHGLRVHEKHGFKFSDKSEDGWARLVVE